jgi:hypothetical protein
MQHNEKSVYGFRQRSTGRFITGTDRSNGKPRQLFNEYHPPFLCGGLSVQSEIATRRINERYYDVVEVKVTPVDKA